MPSTVRSIGPSARWKAQHPEACAFVFQFVHEVEDVARVATQAVQLDHDNDVASANEVDDPRSLMAHLKGARAVHKFGWLPGVITITIADLSHNKDIAFNVLYNIILWFGSRPGDDDPSSPPPDTAWWGVALI